MKLTLEQTEINTALDSYVRELLGVSDDAVIHLTFKNARGNNGMQAFVNILPAGSELPVEEAPTAKTTPAAPLGIAAAVSTKRRGRPPKNSVIPTETPEAIEAQQQGEDLAVTATAEEAPAEAEAVYDGPEAAVEEDVRLSAVQTEDESEAAAEVEAGTEEVPATPTRSLFSNMKSPRQA